MRYLLAILAGLAVASPATSGTQALYFDPQNEYDRLLIEVGDDGDTLAKDPTSRYYGLLVDGVSYFWLDSSDGGALVRMSDLAAADDRMARRKRATGKTSRILPEVLVEKRGRRQVNGRTGTVYRLKTTSAVPEFASICGRDFVMSDDPQLVPIGRGVRLHVELQIMLMSPSAEREQRLARNRDIFALGTPLECGSLRLKSVRKIAIDPERLTLPTKPLTVDEIVARFGT